jgi:hypothetical protein
MTMRSKRMPGPRSLLAVAAVVVLLAGCAQQGGARSGGEAGGAPAPSTTAPTPPSTTTPAGTQPVPGGSDVVVRGTVRAGVERGCLLLDGQDKQSYLLLVGDPSTLRPGARVEVVGQRTDQIVSTCNQGGVTLSVVSVRPLR